MWDETRKPIRLPDENIVILVGRLTRDPKFFTTSGGHDVCRFRIAVNHRYKLKDSEEWKDEATFVPVTAWRGLAKRCANLTKGSAIRVEGKLHTNPGRDDYPPSLEVSARRVQFLQLLPSKAAETPAPDAQNGQPEEAPRESLEQTARALMASPPEGLRLGARPSRRRRGRRRSTKAQAVVEARNDHGY